MKEISIGNLEFYNEVQIIDLQLDINNIYPELEDIVIIPTKIEQLVRSTKYGFNEVKVESIPDDYIIPNGEIIINKNGIYDVTELNKANVNIPVTKLGIKNVTENGTYKAIDDNLDGYSEFTVNTNGVDIEDYFYLAPRSSVTTYLLNRMVKKIPSNFDMSKVTNASYAFFNFGGEEIPELDYSNVTTANSIFEGCSSLRIINNFNATNITNSLARAFYGCLNLLSIPIGFNTSNITNLTSTFYNCTQITSLPSMDTSKVTNFGGFVSGCRQLDTIPELDGSSSTILTTMFNNCTSLTNFGGFLNLGMAYKTTMAANTAGYRLDLSDCPLTHDSLMNVINKLYDIKTAGCKTQSLILGSTNLAKLTADEIAIATNKGWTVS